MVELEVIKSACVQALEDNHDLFRKIGCFIAWRAQNVYWSW